MRPPSSGSPGSKLKPATRNHDGETKTGMPNGRPSDSPLPRLRGGDGVDPVMLTMLRARCRGGRQAEYPQSDVASRILSEEPFIVGAMTTTADHPVHSRVEHDAGEPLVDRTAAAVDCSPEVPVVPSLSPSRAADFMTCPLLFRFRTIDRLPERPSAQAARGRSNSR